MGVFDVTREISHTVTDLTTAAEALRDHFRFARAGALPPWEQDRYETEWAQAFVTRVQVLSGAGRRDVLEDILEHWDTHVTDEVDDNPERNPHVGFVPAEKSGLLDALMQWRGGDLNDYVDPFAVHTVTVEYVVGVPGPKPVVRHPVDCDRLPYGELCAFDKVSDYGKSLCLPSQCMPGEYEAWIRRTDNMMGAGEEYIEIGEPVVRES